MPDQQVAAKAIGIEPTGATATAGPFSPRKNRRRFPRAGRSIAEIPFYLQDGCCSRAGKMPSLRRKRSSQQILAEKANAFRTDLDRTLQDYAGDIVGG